MYKFIRDGYDTKDNTVNSPIVTAILITDKKKTKTKIHDKYYKIREKVIQDVYKAIRRMINEELTEKVFV